MGKARRGGFTLIELLVVIAIIAILAGIVLGALPGVLLRAKLRAAESNMRQAAVSLNTYFQRWGSYPPGYGYGKFGTTLSVAQDYVLEPWTSILGIYNAPEAMDNFSQDTHDTNQNRQIDMLEYLPVGQMAGPNNRVYPLALFDPSVAPGGAVAQDIQRQLQEQRPWVYLAANSNDMRKVEAYYNNPSGNDFIARQRAQVWDSGRLALQTVMNKVPARYDAFVLISVGPNGHTAGVLPEPLADSGANLYYMTALRGFFLATRDANGNGETDFDWRSRDRGSDGDPGAYRDYPGLEEQMLQTPDGGNRPGPLIFVNK